MRWRLRFRRLLPAGGHFPALTGRRWRGCVCGRLHAGRGRLRNRFRRPWCGVGSEATRTLVLVQCLRDRCDRLHDRRLGEHLLRHHLQHLLQELGGFKVNNPNAGKVNVLARRKLYHLLDGNGARSQRSLRHLRDGGRTRNLGRRGWLRHLCGRKRIRCHLRESGLRHRGHHDIAIPQRWGRCRVFIQDHHYISAAWTGLGRRLRAD
jgi:hypothetical protein